MSRVLQLCRVSGRDCFLNFRQGAGAILNEENRNFPQQLFVATDAREGQLEI
jgi:hypothetical protein